MSDPAIIDDSSADLMSDDDTPSPSAKSSTPATTNTPTTSGGSNSATTSSSSANNSRRPPRKSTLTQQQKNQKRQRATQDQLLTLEHEFAKNSTPNAAVRERIAQEINMTERSVQIWFQNSRRRAKIKMIAKKGMEDGSDMDEQVRHMLALQAMHSRNLPPHLVGFAGAPIPYGGGNMLMGSEVSTTGKVVIHHFTCRSLSVGSWRRVGQNAMDLVVFYSPDKACITYYINNDSAGYKIEYPFAFIKNITLDSGDIQAAPNGAPPRTGGLVIELNRPPNFFMDSSGQGGFYQCGDFTEDQQASQIMTHYLGGHPKQLGNQLAKLISLESYINRHNPFGLHQGPASAPVSPTMGIARPASQPNVHFARPHPPNMGYVGESSMMPPGLQPSRMGGHKRQRSRSVPIAIDFSMMPGAMPTFNIQQPSPQDFHLNQPFFQGMPQHMPQPIGPHLQVDTSAGYGMDLKPMPMSASVTTPSEFASPAFFPSQTHQATPQTVAEYNTPYSMPFLSPSPLADPNMIPQSHTPLSHMSSHHEPMIAGQSPPLQMMQRSASADMFSFGPNDPNMLHDDTLLLGDMYAKHNLNMPMPSPGFGENGMFQMQDMDFHTPREHMDMQMNPFAMGTIDPNSLGIPQ